MPQDGPVPLPGSPGEVDDRTTVSPGHFEQGGPTDSIPLPGAAASGQRAPSTPSLAPRPTATDPVPMPPSRPPAPAAPSPAPPPSAPRAPSVAPRPDPTAVPLPGTGGQRAMTDVDSDDLDLGLDDEPVGAAPRAPSLNSPSMPEPADLPGLVTSNQPPSDLPGLVSPQQPPTDLPGLVQAPAMEDPLGFLNDQAARLDTGASEGGGEFRVRHRDGRIEGPFGLGHLQARLRAGELKGNEDISPDGVAWRAMTSNAALNQTINQVQAAADPLAYGQVDLPMSRGTDLPAPAGTDLPGVRELGGPGAGSDGLSDLKLDTGALPSTREPDSLDALMAGLDTSSEAAVPVAQPPPPSMVQPSSSQPPAGLELSSEALEVGEIPDVPPVWEQYKTQIIIFAVAMGVVVVGAVMQFATPYGAYGIPALITYLTTEPPAPPPTAPAPPPPKVIAPAEIEALMKEGSFEAYRSVVATLEATAASKPDDALTVAQAQAYGSLLYGGTYFPLAQTERSLKSVAAIDLSQTRGGNAEQARLEALEARAAAALASSDGADLVAELQAESEKSPSRPNLAFLLGLAHEKADRLEEARAAYDRAVLADAAHGPTLHALARISLAVDAGEQGADEAVAWADKALAAQPKLGLPILRTAELLEGAGRTGAARVARRTAAEHAAEALPPDRRAPITSDVARTYDDLGRLDEVVSIAQEAARLEPGSAEHVALAAVADALAGAPEAGLARIEPVLTREPTNVDALLARGRVYGAQQEIGKLFLDLEAAKAAAPQDYRVYLWDARFNLKLGKLEEARESFVRAQRLAADTAVPTIELGFAELEAGDVEAAFKQAKSAVDVAPHDARSHVLLADCYVERGEFKKALKVYQKAVTIDPDNLSAFLGEANMLREMASREPTPAESELLAQAIPLYERAMERDGDNPRILFEYGRGLELRGELPQALELYEKATALDANDVRPHLRVTAAYLEREPPDLEAAGGSLARAQKIEAQAGKQYADVRFWEARYKILKREYSDAVASMRQAVEKEPRNAEFHYWLGKALEKNNSLYEAIAAYEDAVRLNSRYAQAQRALGWTELERHRFKKARQWFAKYQKMEPTDFSIYVDIGESYTRQNKDTQALKAFQKALGHDPNDVQAILQIGKILSRQGKEAQAAKKFERVIELEPTNSEAWCLVGISRSQRKVTVSARQALDTCIAADDAPVDMQEAAQEILDTAFHR